MNGAEQAARCRQQAPAAARPNVRANYKQDAHQTTRGETEYITALLRESGTQPALPRSIVAAPLTTPCNPTPPAAQQLPCAAAADCRVCSEQASHSCAGGTFSPSLAALSSSLPSPCLAQLIACPLLTHPVSLPLLLPHTEGAWKGGKALQDRTIRNRTGGRERGGIHRRRYQTGSREQSMGRPGNRLQGKYARQGGQENGLPGDVFQDAGERGKLGKAAQRECAGALQDGVRGSLLSL